MTKLTPPALRTLLKKTGRHSDGQGLFFRVLPDNKAYFVYRFRIARREREMSLGPYPELSLGEARAKHAELRALVLHGIDPLAGRRGGKGVIANSGVPTFGAMADRFIALNEGSWRSSKHARQVSSTLATYCKPIWSTPIDAIDTQAVLACLTPIWALKPETASRVRARIETVLDFAKADDETKPNPARWKGHLAKKLPNPRKVGKERGHHAAMDYRDLPAFMATLAEIDTMAARALRFTILTCARTGEALNATFDEVSFDTATWTVPKERMKMGREFSVPLSDAAIAILRAQESRRGSNPFVFPGRPMRPLSGMSMSMLLRRMKVQATTHGFRSSARSWMADQGVPFELAEQCLAHAVGNAVVQAYQRSSMLERRAPIMSAWAKFLSGEADDNVIPLNRRA